MNYDIPKLPPQPQCVVERSIISTSPVPRKDNDPFNEPAQHAESFGGLFVGNASGTSVTASGISPSPSPEIPSYIPEYGPLPEIEVEKQHMGDEMELAKEIKPLT